MARVTVEDCIDKVTSRFDLILLVAHRARQLSQGEPLMIDRNNDKNTVVALREIAESVVSPEDLRESLIHALQKQVEVDEPDVDPTKNTSSLMNMLEDKSEEVFDQMSEEELLAGIENLVAPTKNDDF